VRPRLVLTAVAAASLLAACSSAGAKGPDWSPQPEFPGDGGGTAAPALPGPPLSPGSQPPAVSPSRPSGSAKPAVDPAVVAKHLAAPIGLVLLPDGTALVGERTTGRILRVKPTPGQPVQTVRTLSGLDTYGDGGLLDLALSPTYAEDQLIFAYITTDHDNRVVDFTLTGPVTPVFTGIPRGVSGNAGRIAFGADGELYIGTGDAGVSTHVTDPHSLAGKVLRVSTIGKPSPGNASGGAVFAIGIHEVDGLCVDASTGTMLATESRPTASSDLVAQVVSGALTPLGAPPRTSGAVGGCAVNGGVLYVASRDGKDLLGAPFALRNKTTASLGKWTPYLINKYGRLRTVVTAPDGALWLTTSNRDGHGRPVADDERVLRIQPPSQAGVSPA